MDDKITHQFQERREQIAEQKMFVSSLIQNLENEMKKLDEKYSLVDKEEMEYYKSLKNRINARKENTMGNESKYAIKVTLRDGSCYEYETGYRWEVHEDKLNDTRRQYLEFNDGYFITARDSVLKVEVNEIKPEDEKENA